MLRGDFNGLATSPFLQILEKKLGRTDRCAHQKELRIRQFEKRHLPSPPSITIRVIVKLVNYRSIDRGRGAVTQSNICQDFLSATDNWRARVD